jgi:hypothetical protein
MELMRTPCRIKNGVSIQHIGAETLVYDAQRHLAFCLNPICATVWNLADGSRSVEQLGIAASAQLGAEVSAELVALTLQTLRADGLIAPPAPDFTAWPAPALSRRALLKRLGTGGAMLLPVVASIVAPTAAQAYNGCVDCSTSNSRAARIRKLQQSSGVNQTNQ